MAQALDNHECIQLLNMNSHDNLLKLACDMCEEQYCSEELSQCKHPDCSDDKKIYCKDCGEYSHTKKKKGHLFVIQEQIQPGQQEGEEEVQQEQVMYIYISYKCKD